MLERRLSMAAFALLLRTVPFVVMLTRISGLMRAIDSHMSA